jgi:hypothetical protein
MCIQLCTVPPCLSGEKGCIIYPTILEEAADRGARIDGSGVPLVSMKGETMPPKHLLVVNITVFVFICRVFIYFQFFTFLLSYKC